MMISRFLHWLDNTIFGPYFRSDLGRKDSPDEVISEHYALQLLPKVKAWLAKEFQIVIEQPILLGLQVPEKTTWQSQFAHVDGRIGRYERHHIGSHSNHFIYIRPGLSIVRFCAICAHELVHAYQVEQGLLKNNLALREGMARWVEYHYILEYSPKDADRVLHIKHYNTGKSVHDILALEQKTNRQATLDWLKKQGTN